MTKLLTAPENINLRGAVVQAKWIGTRAHRTVFDMCGK
jgi:hypothetical protein